MTQFVFDPDGEVARAIDDDRASNQGDGRRAHLGCSIIGRECTREIWYSFRWAAQVQWSGRMLRLFDRGNREEEVFVSLLRSIGCEVWDHTPNGDQYRVSFADGYIGGSIDGVAKGIPGAPETPHLLEFKTHNDKSFQDMKKKGLIESKPAHYAQMQMYMKGMKLKRGLYMAVNKNNDEIYTERVSYDATVAKEYLGRGIDIVEARVPPPKISNRPDWYQCRWCNFSGQCHKGLPLSKNCRTCDHVQMPGAGRWTCGRTNKDLSTTEQRNGCEEWKST